VELLKQAQYSPFKIEDQVISLYALTRGYMDDVPVEKIRAFETGLIDYVNTNCKEFGQDIQKEKMWTDASEAKLKEVIAGYKNLFTNGQ
jgi:F-type H+-transporting ATPase subunit alpha